MVMDQNIHIYKVCLYNIAFDEHSLASQCGIACEFGGIVSTHQHSALYAKTTAPTQSTTIHTYNIHTLLGFGEHSLAPPYT